MTGIKFVTDKVYSFFVKAKYLLSYIVSADNTMVVWSGVAMGEVSWCEEQCRRVTISPQSVGAPAK